MEEELKKITDWQIEHEISDTRSFTEIKDMFKDVANKKDIENAVAKAVQITVNGKLVDIKSSQERLKEHLERQDVDSAAKGIVIASIKEELVKLSEKIQPLDVTRTWLQGSGKVIMYLASFIGAIAVIGGGLIYIFSLIK